jgi:hypothetical protein
VATRRGVVRAATPRKKRVDLGVGMEADEDRRLAAKNAGAHCARAALWTTGVRVDCGVPVHGEWQIGAETNQGSALLHGFAAAYDVV